MRRRTHGYLSAWEKAIVRQFIPILATEWFSSSIMMYRVPNIKIIPVNERQNVRAQASITTMTIYAHVVVECGTLISIKGPSSKARSLSYIYRVHIKNTNDTSH